MPPGHLTTRIAPYAPSPTDARALSDEQALRAIAGAAIADEDAEILQWILDDRLACATLGRPWQVGERLDEAACADLADRILGNPAQLDLTPLGIVFLGDILGAIADDWHYLRLACADAAEAQLAADRVLGCADIDDAQLAALIDTLSLTPRPRLRRGAAPALAAYAAQVQSEAAALRDSAWIEVDRTVLSGSWSSRRARVLHDAVAHAHAAGGDGERMVAHLARAAELTGDGALARQLMACDFDGMRAVGALLASCLDAPDAVDAIHGFICAVDEVGVTAALAAEYGARLPGALARTRQADAARWGMLQCEPAGFAAWSRAMRWALSVDEPVPGLWSPAAAALCPAEVHAVGMCQVDDIPVFQRWQGEDDSFLRWAIHLEPTRRTFNQVVPCLLAVVGAMIAGRWHTATAVIPLGPAMPHPDSNTAIRQLIARRMSIHGIAGICTGELPIIHDRSILDREWREEPPSHPLSVRPDAAALLGFSSCPHARGHWVGNEPGPVDGDVADDAMVRICDACDMPTEVIPLHQVARQPLDGTYLARENIYRALRGEDLALSPAQLRAHQRPVILTPTGSRVVPLPPPPPPGLVPLDLAGTLFG